MKDSSSTGAGSPEDRNDAGAPHRDAAAAGQPAAPQSGGSPLRRPVTIDLTPEPAGTGAGPGGAKASAADAARSTSASRPETEKPARVGEEKAGEAAEKRSAAPSSSGSAPPSGGGGGSGLVGGLLAAVIGAAAGVAGAWLVFVVSPPGIATIQDDGALEQRFSALEQQLAANVNALAPRAEVVALGERVAALDRRLNAVAAEAKQLASQAAPAAAPPAPPDGAGAQQVAARLAVLADELAALRKAEQETAAVAGDARQKIDALAATVRDVDPQRAASAEQAAAKAEQAAAGLARRVDDVDARLAALGQRLDARGGDALMQDLARALAAAEARAAIVAGRPFSPDVARLAAGGDAALAAPLERGAAGVAPLARLQRDFAALAGRLSVLQHRDESVLDRLGASAARLVRVRPVDADGAPVTAQEGTVERVSDLLERGDLAGALQAWRALPQPLQTESEAFGAALAARTQAEAAARAALDQALAAIARQTAPAGSDTQGRRQ
ncbi:hypothetical protein ACFFJB_12155 [Camelimonas abortus]|uniref:Inner membrane protein n=1 Tax=Camelimonas abortus TaxID=1017184 RepID=A0ABV7LCH5_9HYPH